MVRMLIEAGADINFKKDSNSSDGGETALHYAVNSYKPETGTAIIEYLIQHGADINATDGADDTPLTYAVDLAFRNKEFGAATILLENGARTDIPDIAGNTILFRHGNNDIELRKKMVTLLTRYGTDINSRNTEGETLLMKAVGEHNYYLLADKPKMIEWINFLLDAKADISLSDNKGNTALMIAAMAHHQQEAVIKLLLDRGANINHKNRYGKTAVDVAKEKLIKNYLINPDAS